jgi:hypothetical protein
MRPPGNAAAKWSPMQWRPHRPEWSAAGGQGLRNAAPLHRVVHERSCTCTDSNCVLVASVLAGSRWSPPLRWHWVAAVPRSRNRWVGLADRWARAGRSRILRRADGDGARRGEDAPRARHVAATALGQRGGRDEGRTRVRPGAPPEVQGRNACRAREGRAGSGRPCGDR